MPDSATAAGRARTPAGGHGQLELLMAHRIADPLLAAVKHMPATATVRQMRDPLVQPLGRDQLPGLALMPGLAAGLAHRALVRLPRQPSSSAETPADPTTAACSYSPSSGQGDARAPRPAHAAARPRQATPAPAAPPAPRPPTRSPLPRHAARTQDSLQHAGTLLITTTPPERLRIAYVRSRRHHNRDPEQLI